VNLASVLGLIFAISLAVLAASVSSATAKEWRPPILHRPARVKATTAKIERPQSGTHPPTLQREAVQEYYSLWGVRIAASGGPKGRFAARSRRAAVV
jgi:hypothetical protein